MNTDLEFFYNVAGIVLWLTAFPALSMAGRIIRRNPIRADRSTHLFLWFVLAGFFRIPLVDLLSNLANLIAQTIPSDPNMGALSIRMGITGIIVKLTIYAFGIYHAQRIIAHRNIAFLKALTLSSLERGFIVLGLAGLIYNLIGDLIGNFILVTFSGAGN